MAQPQKHPLRPLSKQEERELHRIVKASSERIDVARRARALLSVAAKQSFAQAAGEAGFKEARSVGKLVKRFNAHGPSALSIAAGPPGATQFNAPQQRRPSDPGPASARW